ncbi:Ribosomal large subunit pseudouridine synthase B [Klebsiella pneumoniae IS43]|uniref:Ribosomal large subunit pseudouridine synthase B n=1 Tax=Klebsiella pneumoniae IS43 TaxID=1432552 RepID=W1DJ95_KLEPN|nr:Ribosomal large subunit pseudouridine synthase B [Klebsiella pneumoniae IS43]VTO28190.1 ribosomal large subunit pseudouridine synthase B [Klebsiella pneumoniae]
MSEKLQKVLARAGHGSRREIEAKIEAGRVSVDGKIATLGDRVEIVPGLKNSYRWSSDLGERVCRADLPRAGLL